MLSDLTFGAFTAYQTFSSLAADHSGEQKDSMMNLHYSHSQGHFQSLKVSQRTHPKSESQPESWF